MSDVSIYSRKVVIDGVYDPVREIELEEAKKLAGDDVEEGDEIDILEDPKSFDRSAVSSGKQFFILFSIISCFTSTPSALPTAVTSLRTALVNSRFFSKLPYWLILQSISVQ